MLSNSRCSSHLELNVSKFPSNMLTRWVVDSTAGHLMCEERESCKVTFEFLA